MMKYNAVARANVISPRGVAGSLMAAGYSRSRKHARVRSFDKTVNKTALCNCCNDTNTLAAVRAVRWRRHHRNDQIKKDFPLDHTTKHNIVFICL